MPTAIGGLWVIAFGNAAGSEANNDQYFASSPLSQTHGLFGFIAVR
jgi:hypothetical protein